MNAKMLKLTQRAEELAHELDEIADAMAVAIAGEDDEDAEEIYETVYAAAGSILNIEYDAE